jgi:pyridoxal phosphate enzyme (YggS family)
MAVPIMGHYENAWQAVMRRVAAAAIACGRAPESVQLLAVSKTFPAEAVRAVYDAGQRAFGENYVQEAAAKRAALADLTDVSWHLIGPLQSNKTALAAAFDWVETVDRVKIAQRLSAQRPPGTPPLSVCIEVNVSGEASKSGVAATEAVALAREVAALPNLRVRGIMGIPAPTSDTEAAADLELAIAEGATRVRVGTAIFGTRA